MTTFATRFSRLPVLKILTFNQPVCFTARQEQLLTQLAKAKSKDEPQLNHHRVVIRPAECIISRYDHRQRQFDAGDEAVSSVQAEIPGLHTLFPDGRLLRDLLRGRQNLLEGAGPDANQQETRAAITPSRLAGVPWHAVDGYLRKMLQAGYKVAVCEQIEDPKTAKGVVKRDVVRVVTPGTLTDDILLEAKQDNFLAAVWQTNSAYRR